MLLCKQAEKCVQLQVEQSDWLADTDEEIDEQELEAYYNYMAKIQEVPNADSGTNSEPLEQVQYDTGYNVFANEIQHSEQSESISNTCVVETECDDERVALANLFANLILDVDENKKIQKQLKKANTTLAHELTECKSILVKTSSTLEESNSIQDSCLVTLQNKQTGLEKYKTFNDRTVDYKTLEHKLNETIGLLAQKDIDIKEGLKLKAYEILVVKEKHDELVKQSLLTKSHYEGLVKDKTKVITDLKLKEEKDIDQMISMEKQLKFLNEIVYKRSQSIHTIHMLAPKCPTFNGRPTFANPMCLKKAQSEIPCLYEILHDQSDPANSLILDREETLTLERESREKMNNDLVKPYDYTKELVDQAWVNHSKDHFRAPTAHDMEILSKTCLMPLALKTQNDSFAFVHELKQEMHADLKYVESLEKEVDELKFDKAEFSNMYDMLLQECVSNDVICSYLHSLSDLDAHTELQCLYLHKVKECHCLAQKLLKQTETVSKEVYTELLRSFGKLEKYSISLELALQQCQEQIKNDTFFKVTASNVFQKEREQYLEIQDLKAQLQDKNIAIYELKELMEKFNEKSVETKSDKPSVVRQPNAKRIPKPSVLGKPVPFSDSLERKNFSKKKSVPKTNESKILLEIVTTQNLPQTTREADETPEVLKDFLTMIQRNLQALVISVRTNRGAEFLNKTLHVFFKEEGIKHQTSTPQTPEQNGVVERQNRTLVEASRTMLSASKLPLFFWAKAIATACYTQNRSIIIPTHEKTAYHIINDKKPSIKHLHIFGCTCYLTRDGENLDKMKEKRDPCILVGYSNQSKGYHVYNKRTRLIVESIHLRFDEIKEMSEMSVANDTSSLVPQRQKASDYDNSDPVP
ncbi:integrase, catalytic region, zinc finger, CCHC-type containing protein [Tanacetum coccineum]